MDVRVRTQLVQRLREANTKRSTMARGGAIGDEASQKRARTRAMKLYYKNRGTVPTDLEIEQWRLANPTVGELAIAEQGNVSGVFAPEFPEKAQKLVKRHIKAEEKVARAEARAAKATEESKEPEIVAKTKRIRKASAALTPAQEPQYIPLTPEQLREAIAKKMAFPKGRVPVFKCVRTEGDVMLDVNDPRSPYIRRPTTNRLVLKKSKAGKKAIVELAEGKIFVKKARAPRVVAAQ